MDLRAMTQVPANLQALVDALSDLGSPIGRHLSAGRGPHDVRAAFAQVGLLPTEELVDWFGWHDGIDDARREAASPLEFLFAVEPMSLKAAVDTCRSERSRVASLVAGLPDAERQTAADQFWRDPWFPIMLGTGSIFAADCPDQPTTESSLWRSISHPGPVETGIVSRSIAVFLDLARSDLRHHDSAANGVGWAVLAVGTFRHRRPGQSACLNKQSVV